ncbi:MAG: hypothetical protein QM638_17755 [Nocardioides sp.]|uniref:hypothetical protein n=1 Tax=Nocardioides sp. TaxID=35761 RepID=UPI0039E59E99
MTATTLELEPLAIATLAREWDDQSLDLDAASSSVAAAPTAGFTTAVRGAAAGFAGHWRDHLRDHARQAEARADALRATARTLLVVEQLVGQAAHGLVLDLTLQTLREVR